MHKLNNIISITPGETYWFENTETLKNEKDLRVMPRFRIVEKTKNGWLTKPDCYITQVALVSYGMLCIDILQQNTRDPNFVFLYGDKFIIVPAWYCRVRIKTSLNHA